MSTNQNLAEEVDIDYSVPVNGNGNGAHEDAAVGRRTGSRQDADALDQAAAAHKAAVSDYRFTLAATAVAILYAVPFFGGLLWNSWGTDAFDVAPNAWDSPQTGIAIFLIFAAAFLWLWRGRLGKVLSFLTFSYVLLQFGMWYLATKQIRINTGREVISQGGALDYLLMGAGWLDLITLLAVVALLGFNLYFIKPSRNVKRYAVTETEDNRRSTVARLKHVPHP